MRSLSRSMPSDNSDDNDFSVVSATIGEKSLNTYLTDPDNNRYDNCWMDRKAGLNIDNLDHPEPY